MGPQHAKGRPSACAGGRWAWWRWRESNPRPTVWSQGFSGCSQQLFCSAPAVTLTTRRQAQLPRSPRSPGNEGYEQWLSR